MPFQRLTIEICHPPTGVSVFTGYRVLQHHHPVLVIPVRQRKSLLRQVVKKRLLRLDIRFKSLVIIEMIVRDIRENRPIKIQPANPSLVNSVRTHLHETILTPNLHHPAHQLVNLHCVRCRVSSVNPLITNIITHR